MPWVTPKDMKSPVIGDSKIRLSRAALEATPLKEVPAGSVLLVVRGMILAKRVPIALASRAVTVNQDMKAIVPSALISGRYLALALECAASGLAPLIDEAGHGTRRLPTERWGELLVPVPPPEEQAAIVRFLDHADRRIRRYIRAKQKLIKLLEEQKQAIIHQAVTRGLDPSVPMKDSGVEWIDKIPAHWEVRRAKTVCAAIVDCKNRTPPSVDSGRFVVVRTTCVKSGQFVEVGSYRTSGEAFSTWTARGAPRRGDVFFTREAPAGEACLVPDRDDLCMGQRMMYLRPDPSLLDPDFLLMSIYGPVCQSYITLTTNGSTVGHLRLGQVYGLPLLWCPVEEQKEIVGSVHAQTRSMGLAAEAARREISLLREFRTRLIADVVTGQLDVRAAAAALSDEVGDDEPMEEEDDEGEGEDLDVEDGPDPEEGDA